jgi:hypothetical protein
MLKMSGKYTIYFDIVPNSFKPSGCPALILLITGKEKSPFKVQVLLKHCM